MDAYILDDALRWQNRIVEALDVIIDDVAASEWQARKNVKSFFA
jgi:hypothetical protein